MGQYLTLTAEQWEALFWAYAGHVEDKEGTDYLYLIEHVEEVAAEGGVDPVAFGKAVDEFHRIDDGN